MYIFKWLLVFKQCSRETAISETCLVKSVKGLLAFHWLIEQSQFSDSFDLDY